MISSSISIESQGYDTFLAETNEKNWKEKSERFMKRNKSESNRDLSVTLSSLFCLPLSVAPPPLAPESTFVFLISSLVPRSLNGRDNPAELLLCSCCFDDAHTKALRYYFLCARNDSYFSPGQHGREMRQRSPRR